MCDVYDICTMQIIIYVIANITLSRTSISDTLRHHIGEFHEISGSADTVKTLNNSVDPVHKIISTPHSLRQNCQLL
jgi:hypothetical protein